MKRTLVLMLLLTAIVTIPVACNPQQIAELKVQAAEMRADLAAGRQQLELTRDQRVRLAEAISEMPEGKEKEKFKAVLDTVDQRIEQVTGYVLNVEDALNEFEAKIANADDPLDVADAAVQTTAPFLPPPWNALLAAAGGLAIGLVRAAQNRIAARSIAASMEGHVTGLTATEVDAISAAQGAGGKRIVDEAQGKKLKLPI